MSFNGSLRTDCIYRIRGVIFGLSLLTLEHFSLLELFTSMGREGRIEYLKLIVCITCTHAHFMHFDPSYAATEYVVATFLPLELFHLT